MDVLYPLYPAMVKAFREGYFPLFQVLFLCHDIYFMNKLSTGTPELSFGGSFAGLTGLIKTFHVDTNQSFVSSSNVVPGYYFTLHSRKRELWSLQSAREVLVGIGSPFDVQAYDEYIKTYPRIVRLLLLAEFSKNGFHCTEPLLFSVNNTMRLLPAKEGTYHLVMPDNSVQVMTDPYSKHSSFGKDFFTKLGTDLGERTERWLRDQFKFIRDKKQQFINTQKNTPVDDGE